tara:strand:+ start:276 stop:506 length:231 start_codon:yes stop_codon:yes gene_type:complete
MSTTKTKKADQPKLYVGGLNPNAIIRKTGKIARATHNAERVLTADGSTVYDAINSRTHTAQDLKYDLKTGTITLEE